MIWLFEKLGWVVRRPLAEAGAARRHAGRSLMAAARARPAAPRAPCPSRPSRAATAGRRMTGKERREQLIDDRPRRCSPSRASTAPRSRRSPPGPRSPSRSSTSTSAARRACTPSSSTARCARCSTTITGALTGRATRASCSSRRRSRCSTTSRSPPTASGSWSATRPVGSVDRHRSPRSSATSPARSSTSWPTSSSARGFDPKLAPMYAQMLVGMVGAHRPVVAGRAQAEEGRRRRAPGQPRLERPVRPRGQARAARPRLRAAGRPDRESGSRQRLEQLEPVAVRVVQVAPAVAREVVVPLAPRTPCGGQPLDVRRRGPSTSSPGCALRAGRKSSSTPRCSSTPPARNHTPPRAARSGGFGTSVMPEHVAVEPAQHVLGPGAARRAARGAARPARLTGHAAAPRPGPRRRSGGTAARCPTAAAGRRGRPARGTRPGTPRAPRRPAAPEHRPQPGAADPAHDRVVAGEHVQVRRLPHVDAAAQPGQHLEVGRRLRHGRPALGPGPRTPLAPPRSTCAQLGHRGVAAARPKLPAPGRRTTRPGATARPSRGSRSRWPGHPLQRGVGDQHVDRLAPAASRAGRRRRTSAGRVRVRPTRPRDHLRRGVDPSTRAAATGRPGPG